MGRKFALLAGPAFLVGLAALVAFPAVGAEEKKPARKDSRPQARPKQAVLTPSVSPAEARPGDTVTYSVKAKIDAPWHIYKQSKAKLEQGPKLTTFDFFDTAGLTAEGEWTPSEEPIRKHEPAFPDLPFLEYYEGEVTWSLKLKVPSKATPGKKTLRCQAGYMICNDANCSIPGQWTLPDVELTVLPGPSSSLLRPGSALAPALVGLVQAPAADAPKPKSKDSRNVPKHAAFSAEISPARAKAGDSVTLKVTAKVNEPWHIYKFSATQPDDGPKLTTFDLFDPAGLTPKGEWTPSREPIKKQDNAFPGIPFLEFYEGEVSWSLPLEVPAGLEPGKRPVRVQVGFMLCTDAQCTPPTRLTVTTPELEILPGQAAVASAPAAVAKAEDSVPTAPPAPAPVGESAPAPAAPSSPSDASSPSPRSGSDAAASTSSVRLEDGFLSFLLFCAGGGLFALAMPCVWPMIPVTVNFFVKQGQRTNGSTTGLALAYCLSIVGIFVGIGLLFSVSFGAASLSKLANNPWLNFGVAGLFLVFGLSLLGLFEIRLPNFLLNASAQGESRGGLIGVMFMALTLTITSFTCTFPVVGALLVMAAKGQLFYPVVGLATFAAVLAFPFLLLALSPGLLAKMPRSGDWMNTVKVVGGLIEIGAAFKFLNTAETAFVVPSEAWFNAYTVLTLWVVVALICGVYLLGLFRTDHDHEEVKVGPGRMLGGWLFLSLALFLAPALFGRPPQSRIWYMVVGLLPADAGDLKVSIVGGGGESLAKLATSSDPKQAEREQTAYHGVPWGMSYEGALERAKAEKRPVLIDFTGVNCANCRLMEQEVLPRPEVVQLLKEFVTIQLYTDYVPINSISPEARSELAERNIDLEAKLFEEVTNPNYVALDGEGRVLGKLGGKVSPEVFAGFLKGALDRHKGDGKVAQAGTGR